MDKYTCVSDIHQIIYIIGKLEMFTSFFIIIDVDSSIYCSGVRVHLIDLDMNVH